MQSRNASRSISEDLLRSYVNFFFFSSRRRHTRCSRDWSSDVCSSDLNNVVGIDGDGKYLYDQVGFDDFNGSLQATRYLIKQGHRLIDFAGDISFPWIQRDRKSVV